MILWQIHFFQSVMLATEQYLIAIAITFVELILLYAKFMHTSVYTFVFLYFTFSHVAENNAIFVLSSAI